MKNSLLKLSAALLLLASSQAQAQVVAGSTFFDEIVSDWHLGMTADVSGSAAIPVDVHDAMDGTLGIYQASTFLRFQGATQKRAILASLGYDHTFYRFSSDYAPFRDTNDARFSIFATENIDENWSIFGMALGTMGAESGADFFDAGRMMAAAGAGYKFSDTLKAGLGAGAISRLDNTWLPIPMAYVDWQITKRLSLRTFTGLALIYDVYGDGTLLLNLSGQYNSTYFRLRQDGAGNKRSFEDSCYVAAVGATYNFGKHFYVSGSAGGAFGRELEFRTARRSAETIDVDSAPIFYLHFGCKF